jgi:hypothetical protein
VKEAFDVTAVIVVAAVVVPWAIGRVVKRIREPLGVVRFIVIRVGLGVILSLVTVQAVTHGGAWLALAPFVALLALWSFAVAAGGIWVWAR